MKTRIAIATAMILTLVVVLTLRYQAQRNLRTENEALREQLTAMEFLADENTRLSNILAQAARPAVLPNPDTSELARLRAEVARLRGENAELRAARSKGDNHKPPAELATEIAQHKLRFAEALLHDTEERFKAGIGSQADLDRARLARDLMEAEVRHDPKQALRLKYELAENRFQALDTGLRSTARFTPSPGTHEEFDRARYARDLALAEMNENRREASRIKLEAADASLKYVADRFTRGNASQRDYLEAKLAREIATSEHAHQLRVGAAQ